MQRATVQLPGGHWDPSGILHREVDLAAMTGREEELLADVGRGSADLVTVLLSRCVRRIGSIAPVTESVARDLLVGDRQFLLMRLRQLTFGDKVEATVRCPWPDCGEPADIDFVMSRIPVKEASPSAPLHDVVLSPEASLASGLQPDGTAVRFRLPNGGDQEALSPLLASNEAMALAALLSRCLVAIGSEVGVSVEQVNALSPAARQEIEQAMARAAPGIDLTLTAQCPECNRAFPVPFDAQDFVFGEMRGNPELLHREIHYLAYHYHWSAQEILNMTRDKRRRYIETLAEEMERLNSAVG